MAKYTLIEFHRVPSTIQGGGVLAHWTWELTFGVDRFFGMIGYLKKVRVYSHVNNSIWAIEANLRSKLFSSCPSYKYFVDDATCYL